MSLYRKPGGVSALTLAAAAAAALVVGAAVGYAIGSSDDDQAAAQSVARNLSNELSPVADGLSLLPTEYRQAYGGTGDESAGVRGALDRISSSLDGARGDLSALDPAGVRELDRRIALLGTAVRARRPPGEVSGLVASARAALTAVPGGQR